MLTYWEKREKVEFASHSVPLRANGKILQVSVIVIIRQWHYTQIAAQRVENVGTRYKDNVVDT